ncbi:hypothetical protein OG762_05210 [Streptomyces sp. NBC_01136]|uniref:hypothetical protein n=1 Tax=Streptomyces sp. NBC_01136 TaxID=2903754 RepID=UPI00386FF561|nr:hypothetical protein OG762_05210 [Streptomyces sp. NBC_01136]
MPATGGATEAQAQDTQAQEATEAAIVFSKGTRFKAEATIPSDSESSDLTLTFSIATQVSDPANNITPKEIADLLNDLATSRGRPPATFYGTPVPTAPPPRPRSPESPRRIPAEQLAPRGFSLSAERPP